MPGNDVIHPICDRWGRQRNFDFCSTEEPQATWPYMTWIDPAAKLLKVRDKDDSDWLTIGGGGGGAPTNAKYLVLDTHPLLTDERRFVPGDGLQAQDGGPGGNYGLAVKVSDFAGAGLEANLGDLRISAAAAGDGLTGGGGAALAVDATVVRTSGAQTIAGVKTFQDNTIHEDGSGSHSPEIQFVSNTYEDVARIYLLDGVNPGQSALNFRLCDTAGYSTFQIRDWSALTVFIVNSDGDCIVVGDLWTYKTLKADAVNLQGEPDALILDLYGQTTISAPVENQIDFEVAGADQIHLVDGKLYPNLDNDVDLGDSTHGWSGIYAAGDVYPENSTYGLNARFEDLFGNDVPTRSTDFLRSQSLGRGDDPDNNMLGFLTDTTSGSDSYNPPAPFSKSNSGTVQFYVKNHHLRINSLGGTASLVWSSATAKELCEMQLQFMTRTNVAYGGEIRGWAVQNPGSGDAYWAVRFVVDLTGYPDWPWRVRLYTGTGTTFAIADGTLRQDNPWDPFTSQLVNFRAYAGPTCSLATAGCHSQIDVEVHKVVVAGQPAAWKRVQVYVATVYQQAALDHIRFPY